MKKGNSANSIKQFWKKNQFSIICVVGIVITIFLSIINYNTVQSNYTLAFDVGYKTSELKWLARAGMISEEEFDSYLQAVESSSIQEKNQLLDELLEGAEEEYLAKQNDLLE